jgi:hypothetical protein
MDQCVRLWPLGFRRLWPFCLDAKFAVLTFYNQAVALKLGRAFGPDQKGDVGSALEKPAAEISSKRART